MHTQKYMEQGQEMQDLTGQQMTTGEVNYRAVTSKISPSSGIWLLHKLTGDMVKKHMDYSADPHISMHQLHHLSWALNHYLSQHKCWHSCRIAKDPVMMHMPHYLFHAEACIVGHAYMCRICDTVMQHTTSNSRHLFWSSDRWYSPLVWLNIGLTIPNAIGTSDERGR